MKLELAGEHSILYDWEHPGYSRRTKFRISCVIVKNDKKIFMVQV